MKYLIPIFMVVLLFSCKNAEHERILRTISYWQNREIIFPKDTSFISYSRKWGARKMSLQKGEYTILCYVDSIGCMSCKLRLPEWKDFIYKMDSMSHGNIPFVFVFQSKATNDLIHFLKKTGFDYPLFIDTNNNFDRLNGFPTDIQLQTFLLNRDNKVIAMGNPIYNPKVKELYINIVQGKNVNTSKSINLQTEVKVDSNFISLGDFDWQKEQKATFFLKNTGNKPLVVEHVNTSCGCTSVSYSKEPVQPGKDIALEVTYKADHPEHFNKTITVYCNADTSPIVLKISGNAK
ncbi:DUF1573 domain-containing protein [Bacteroides sp. GD17]|jgi:hypothetical protein|uniref:DUF1573 domain-containing protein n=1 Tax=Bacteroides sp. GD17 TaxID=3139826 RepID=UPI0025D83C7F|nr:DUF1573 domain-containing protein [uncultured Bacteroides sp.]